MTVYPTPVWVARKSKASASTLHIGSRRVYLAGITAEPTAAWVAEQGQTMAAAFQQLPLQPRMLLRDFDGKFPAEFDQAFEDQGMRVIKVGPHLPNKNAHMERWIPGPAVTLEKPGELASMNT